MHALSVKQPYAEWIARGEKRAEYRTWHPPRALIGHDLLIVASRTPGEGYAGEPRGVSICVVRVDGVESAGRGLLGWQLSHPRRVAPVEIVGRAACFHVDDAKIRYVATVAPVARDDASGIRLAAPARERSRAQEQPYALRANGKRVGGADTPEDARARARAYAAAHGVVVWIERDGLDVACESPPGAPMVDLSPEPGHAFTFAIGDDAIPGSEATEAEARETARFLSSYHHGKRITIRFQGKPIGDVTHKRHAPV